MVAFSQACLWAHGHLRSASARLCSVPPRFSGSPQDAPLCRNRHGPAPASTGLAGLAQSLLTHRLVAGLSFTAPNTPVAASAFTSAAACRSSAAQVARTRFPATPPLPPSTAIGGSAAFEHAPGKWIAAGLPLRCPARSNGARLAAPRLPPAAVRHHSCGRGPLLPTPHPPPASTCRGWAPRQHARTAGGTMVNWLPLCVLPAGPVWIGTGRIQLMAYASRGGGSGTQARITPEALRFWRAMMDKVDKPSLQAIRSMLEWDHPLGIRKDGKRGGQSNIQCYEDYLRAKVKHPTAVVLVRIGDFYEGVGFDALVLAQWCGLALMGGAACAGFPKDSATFRRHANRMLELGMHVAVVEETGSVAVGRRFGVPTKRRELVQVLTQYDPYYRYGSVEDDYRGEDTPPPRPITAVHRSKTGFGLLRYYSASHSVVAHAQLSEEALFAHLHAQGLAPPLLVHQNVKKLQGVLQARLPNELGASVGSEVVLFGDAGDTAVQDFKQEVCRLVGRPAHEANSMRMLPHGVPESSGGRDTVLMPPAYCTAAQLGLARGSAATVPSLLSELLPEREVPAQAAEALRMLLLLPPPPRVAEGIHFVCTRLAAGAGGSSALPAPPSLYASIPSAKLAMLLSSRVAGDLMMRDVADMLNGAAALLSLREYYPVNCALIEVMQWTMSGAGNKWEQQQPDLLADACRRMRAAIGDVVPDYGTDAGVFAEGGSGAADAEGPSLETFGLPPLADAAGEDVGSESEAAERAEEAAAAGARSKAPAKRAGRGGRAPGLPGGATGSSLDPQELQVPELRKLLPATTMVGLGASAFRAFDAVAKRLEKYRRGVRLSQMPEAAQEVEAARTAALQELLRLGCAVVAECPAINSTFRAGTFDNDVWLELECTQAEAQLVVRALAEKHGHRLVPARDRRNLPVKARAKHLVLTTEGLAAAMDKYRDAAERAAAKSKEVLRTLCGTLSGELVTLLAANELCVLFTALSGHVRTAVPRHWTSPHLPAASAQQAAAAAAAPLELLLDGMWPYWMRRNAAVHNDVALSHQVALLTGPNMAGKSTVLRTMAAIALLANCGLMVPAARAQVPWLSSITLRNFSGDSPLEGKSAFAMEMEDTAHTLQVADRHSLVLLDELGKGTEVNSATALAASVIESLCQRRATGVFATHLHDLIWLLEGLAKEGHMPYWAMQVVEKQEYEGSRLARGRGSSGGAQPASGGADQDQSDLEGGGGVPDPETALSPALRPHSAADASLGVPDLELEPTWRIIADATCTKSLALRVALDHGMPREVLLAAARHQQAITERREAEQRAFAREQQRAGGVVAGAEEADAGDGGAVLLASGAALLERPGLAEAAPAANGTGGGAGPSRASSGDASAGGSASAIGGNARQLSGNGNGVASGAQLRSPVAAVSQQRQVLLQLAEQPAEEAAPREEQAPLATAPAPAAAAASRPSLPPSALALALERTLLKEAAVPEADAVDAPAAAAAAPAAAALAAAQAAAAGAAAAAPAAAVQLGGPSGATGAGGFVEAQAAARGDELHAYDAATVLLAEFRQLVKERQASGVVDASLDMDQECRVVEVQSGCVPPVNTAQADVAFAYVLKWWDGRFYVGETEDIAKRLANHRAKETRERNLLGQALKNGSRSRSTLHCYYVAVPHALGGKSLARELEVNTIGALQRKAFPLKSDHDKRRGK